MVVAVNEHDGLRERLVAEPVESRRDHGALAVIRRERKMARQEPFRKELELAHQEFAVVGRQFRDGRRVAGLHAHQRIDRVRVERLRVGALAERLEVMMPAEVADQHESLLGIHGDHRRHVHAGRREDADDAQPRIEALALGRRVHRDLRAVAAMHAEIAPEARVGGCRQHALDRRARKARDPSFKFLQPRIGVVVSCHAEATAGVPAL